MAIHIRRRDFLVTVGGTAVAWPLAARAQGTRVRRVGVLMVGSSSDSQVQAQVAAFREGLEKLGWVEGRNIRIDSRFAAANSDRLQEYAAELVRSKSDVVLVQSSVALTPVLRESRSIPIVFLQIFDPVGSGYIASFARPGGNVTGFTPGEFSMGAKMLEVLKDVAPHITQVAVLFNPDQVPGVKMWEAIKAAGPSIAVDIATAGVHDVSEIKRAVEGFAVQPNGGLVVLASIPTNVHRKLILELAERHRLPAVYAYSFFAKEGGLESYGNDLNDQYRQAASYVDRILKGASAGDLPVQQPTKFELVINLKTAKALGLTINREILLRADELIE
jgi:putative ABC transport system substrate-binding protein